MKYFLLFFLLISSVKAISQQRFESYVVNDKYCIVDLNTMLELETPNYIARHDAYADVLSMIGDGYTDFYDKNTGFLKRFNQNRPDSFTLDGKFYFSFYDEGNTVLIPGYYSKRIVLTKKYEYLRAVQNFLICRNIDLYDVYEASNLDVPVLEGLVATNYFNRYVKDNATNKVFELHLFFGKDKTYFFNSDFKLIKTGSFASDFFDVEKKVLENYTILEDVPKVKDEVLVIEGLFEKNSKSMRITKKDTFVIETNDVFNWSYYDFDDTVSLYNYDRSEYYIFKVDFENKRFLIPTVLKEKIGLKFKE